MRNPRNRTSFAATYHENRTSVGATTTTTTSSDPGTQDTCTRRKRVRFALGSGCLPGSESGAKAKLSDVDNPKTIEYAFFKKLRKDAGKPGLPAQKEMNKTNECKYGDGLGVGNRISPCFQNLKSSLHAQDVKPMDSSSLLSPIAGLSKAIEMNYVEQPDFRNSECRHPIKKAMHADFNTSCSPFGDQVKSAVVSYVYGQGNFFSAKRDKLLQHVADTYPESKELNLNGKDLVNSMLGRLFPNGYDSKRARKLRQQDTCTSWLTGYPENTTDCEKFSWPGYHGSTEVGDLLLLDYGSMSSDSTELTKWSGEYSMSPDQIADHELVHHKTKKPYIIADYVKSRSPWMNHHRSRLPCETFVTGWVDDVPSEQNLLLGWLDDRTEDEDQLELAPYNFHTGKTLHYNRQALLKNDYQLEPNIDFSSSRIPPQIISGHYYGDMDSYFETMENTDSYITSDRLLDDKETERWDTDIIHSRGSGSYLTHDDGDYCLLRSPSIFATQEFVSSDYARGQMMCIDQPWEVCGKNVTSLNYITDDYHLHRDKGYDEPIYDHTTYGQLPL